MNNLRQAQASMRVRHGMRPHTGRPCAYLPSADPIEEVRIRCAMAVLWLRKAATARELATRFERPLRWVETWLDSGLPLI